MKFYVILSVLNTILIAISTAPVSEQTPGDDVGEYGEYFEGDMLLTNAQLQAIEDAKTPYNDKDAHKPKNGLLDESSRWPNKTVVYYIQEDNFSNDQITLIEEALQDIEDKSCVKFRKRKTEEEHVVVIERKKEGCFSSVGYSGGPSANESEPNQILNLSDKCFRHGTIVHEMLHTLGFYHMQSTYDRDEYVTIVWENIKSGAEHNFAKYTNDTVTDFGVPYDYGSVMHYSDTAFSKNGNRTIIPKKEGVTLGQRRGLSKRDILKLNRMYDCPPKEVTTTEKDNLLDIDFWNTITVIRP